MGFENEAKFTLTLDGDGGNVGAIFAAFKKQVKSDLSEIEATSKNLKLFGTLDADLKKAATSVDDTKAKLASLRTLAESLAVTGGTIGKGLETSLRDAGKAAVAAEKDFARQSVAVDRLRTTLKSAGVDLSNLAAAELKLAAAARQAAAAQIEQQNKTATGFKTLRDIAPEVNRITAAYNALASSGKLSFGELSTLHARAQQQINQLRSQVGGLGAAFREVRGSIVAFAAAFAGIVAAGAKSAENFRDFSTQIAAVGTIADVSDAKLAEFADGVRQLSRDMGVDAVNAAKALYDIIGSNVSADNALTALALSAKAARAGLTDVKTAASGALAAINGFGLPVRDLEHVLDVMFQTVKDGVITFSEFGSVIGDIAPVARLAGVSIEEIGAALATLTVGGVSAPEAATSISRAIQSLSDPVPEAAKRFADLNIEFRGLVGTIEQISKLNLSTEQFGKLIPEVRAAKAVAALSQNFAFLNEQLRQAKENAGQMQAAYERMAATPQAKIDRFNASVKDLSLSVGEFVTNNSGFIETLTKITNGFNGMGDKAKQSTISIVALTVALAGGLALLRALAVPLNLLAGALASMGTSGALVAKGFTAVTLAVTALQAGIAFLLGFRLGEILYEWSASVRVLGDVLGLSLGAFSNLANLVGGAVKAAFTFNLQTLKDSWEEYRRHSAILAGDFSNALSLGAEKSRQMSAAQDELGKKLNVTAKAAGDAAVAADVAVSVIASKLDAQARAIEQALTSTQARLTALVTSLTKGVQDITAGAQAAINALAGSVSTQLAALSGLDIAKVTATVEIQKKAAIDRLAILKKFGEDAIAAVNAEAAARKAIAEKSNEDLKVVDQQLLLTKQATLQAIVDGFKAHVDQLVVMERGHLDKIKEIENERRGINQDVEDKIREIRRSALDAYGQYQDKIRQIDDLTSKARIALAAGDSKLAEDYAKQAIALAGTVATAVTNGTEQVVSASTAQSTAIQKIQAAQDLLNKSLTERVEAERAGAKAAAEGLSASLPLLEQYKAKLAEVNELAKAGIKVKIDADVAAVTEAVDKLAVELAARKITLQLIAELKDAQGALAKAKEQLAAGVPVQLVAKTEALKQAIENIQAQKPELQIETAAALGKVADLAARAAELANLRPEITATVVSNVDEVQSQIDALKQPTESTHTIYVKTVQVSAAGGVVGAFRRGGPVARGFARGGHVFRRPAWDKVPGIGDGDTVPALLNAGAFVVRKAASKHYGDGLMSRLVQNFAVGGNVLSPGSIAGAILLGGKSGTSLGGFTDDFRETMEQLFTLREEGRTLPKSSTGLDIAEWAARLIVKFPLFDKKKQEKIKNVLEAGFEGWLNGIETARAFRVPAVMEFGIASLAFRRGGGGKWLGRGTDTVPAMLTPGEYVVSKPAVDRYGSGLLHAINSMRISRESLAGMLQPPRQAARFATGGQVGRGMQVTIGRGGVIPSFGGITINNYGPMNERFVDTVLIPKIRSAQRRAGKDS